MRKAKKTRQVPTRFTEKTVQDLDRIASLEDRDRSELVRFLVDWAIAQYDLAGSLRRLQTLTVLPGRVVGYAENGEPIVDDIKSAVGRRALELKKK